MSTDDPAPIKILIAYNDVPPETAAADIDAISEIAVKDEVAACQQALQACGYQVQLLPCSSVPPIIAMVESYQPDVVFNLCEGFRRQARLEAPVAGLWELLGLPYTGNPFPTLCLAQDKVMTKRLLIAENIPTPPYQVMTEPSAACTLDWPVIAKPSCEDGSVGITQESLAFEPIQLREVVGRLMQKYHQPILVEKFIAGREFNISILGNDPVQVLPIAELSFSQVSPEYHPFTSYEAKWLPEHPLYQMTPAICPAAIDSQLQEQLTELALRVYRLLGGQDYGRVDVRLNEEGEVFVLEYNPNPDISPDAGFVRALRAAGWDYERFVAFLVQEALRRKSRD